MSSRPRPFRHVRTHSWSAVALALPLWGCHHAPDVAPAPRVSVPAGCERNLSGEYVHADDSSYRYLGADDGGTLVLRVRRELEDAGTAPTADPGDTTLVLERTSAGFLGQVRSLARNSNKARCPVTFPAQVLACDGKGLLLRSTDTALNEACQQPPPGNTTPWVEQRLRVRAGGAASLAADAGS